MNLLRQTLIFSYPKRLAMSLLPICQRKLKNELIYRNWKFERFISISRQSSLNKVELQGIKKYSSKPDCSYLQCGKVCVKDIGKRIRIRGFLQFQRLNFIVIRDSSGLIQVLINVSNAKSALENVNYETYLEVLGNVVARPEQQINKDLSTGHIEMDAEEITILNHAKARLPFLIRDKNMPIESLALKYRYLHLRYPHVQKALRLRSQVNKKMRDYLQDIEDFVEITTPTLSVNTPGGSQEYVVPTQIKNQFYSLVQSPQMFKQMSIIGGFEKYFQFAICYRDEGVKTDRQPEFMQLDIELANTSIDDIKKLTENLITHSWPNPSTMPVTPFPVMPFDEAFNSYGVDKPDTRFKWKIENVTNIVKKSEAKIFAETINQSESEAVAFVIPEGKKYLTKKVNKEWNLLAKTYNLAGVSLVHVNENGGLIGSASKAFSQELALDLINQMIAKPSDSIVLAVGHSKNILSLLGKLRIVGADLLESQGVDVRDKTFNFLWVEDFPLFEIDDKTGSLSSCHHPFTAPIEEHVPLLRDNPLQVKSQHYDLILNGCEIAGGSIRNHSAEMQKKILEKLDIDPTQLQFLLEALDSGAPPHGGIALGFDRYISMILGTNSIRDVMAFPKSGTGKCFLTGAPSTIPESEMELYHLNKTIDSEIKE